jgi:hypothetical protein
MIKKNENKIKAQAESLLQQLQLSNERLIEELENCQILIKQAFSLNQKKKK